MFDLDEAVRDWRQRLNDQPDIQEGDLEELEDHLREGVTELQAGGLNDEEAFLIAARRLGDPQVLAGEFAVADPGLRRRVRLRWMAIGALAVIALIFVADIVADFSTGGMASLSIGGPLLGWTSGFLRFMVFVVGAILIWRLLTSDAAAGKIRNLGIWNVGLLTAILAFLTLVISAAFLRGGAVWLLGMGLPSSQLPSMPLIAFWVRSGVLLLLPLMLLFLLWWLARPRRGTR
jgi:hypothetical protein